MGSYKYRSWSRPARAAERLSAPHFSARQKATFRRLARNRRFYISRVTAVGPDGLQRTLPTSMEVIIK